MEMNRREIAELAHQFGGQWCDCIQKIIEPITPPMVAAYCVSKGYKQQHDPLRDEAGVRYGYFLKNKVETRTIQGEQIQKEFKLMAGFGEFTNRPYETLQSCLQAITAIAEFEDRSPQRVAEDILASDVTLAPAPPEEVISEEPSSPMSRGARRYVQNSTAYPI